MNIEGKATLVAMSLAFCLIILKFTVGFFSGSIAIITSAIDSVFDFIFSIINHFAARKAAKAPTEQFNYGFGKIEPLSTLFEGIVLFFIGIYIILGSIYNIMMDKQVHRINELILVITISLFSTLCLTIFLSYVGKKSGSLIVRAELLHYRMDIFTNGGILISFIIIYYTGYSKIDFFFSILVSLYVIKESYKIARISLENLLDISLDQEIVDKIRKVFEDDRRITTYHHLKTRKSGQYYYIDVHVVFDDFISLLDAHNIGDDIEEKIRNIDRNMHWLINIHLDPYDDSVDNIENINLVK